MKISNNSYQKDGTVRKVAVNPYTTYVKNNFAQIKSQNPGKNQKELMAIITDHYKKIKTNVTSPPIEVDDE